MLNIDKWCPSFLTSYILEKAMCSLGQILDVYEFLTAQSNCDFFPHLLVLCSLITINGQVI